MSSFELPSWFTLDKWYVKAGCVVAGFAGITAVGYVYDNYFKPEAGLSIPGLPPGVTIDDLPPQYQEYVRQMQKMQSGGGPESPSSSSGSSSSSSSSNSGGSQASQQEKLLEAMLGKAGAQKNKKAISNIASSSGKAVASPPAERPARSTSLKERELQRLDKNELDMQINITYQRAQQYLRLGKYEESEKNYRQLISMFLVAARTDPEKEILVTIPMQELATLLKSLARFSEAEKLLVQALEIQTKQFTKHPNNLSIFRRKITTQNELATILQLQAKWAAAESVLTDVYYAIKQKLPKNDSGEIQDPTQLQPILSTLIKIAINLSKYTYAESLSSDLEKLKLPPKSGRDSVRWNALNRIPRAQIYLAQSRQFHDETEFSIDDDEQTSSSNSTVQDYISRATEFFSKFEEQAKKIIAFVDISDEEKNSKKVLNYILIIRAIANILVGYNFYEQAAEKFLTIFKNNLDRLDNPSPTADEDRKLRAYIFEAVNDHISCLHNIAKDEQASSHYKIFKSHKCAVLSQSEFMHTKSAKILYDVRSSQTDPAAILSLDLLLTKNSSDQKIKLSKGNVLEISYEKFLYEKPKQEKTKSDDDKISTAVVDDKVDNQTNDKVDDNKVDDDKVDGNQTDDKVDDNKVDDDKVDENQTDDKVDDDKVDDDKVDDKVDDNKVDDKVDDNQTDDNKADDQTDDNKADDQTDDKVDDNQTDDKADDNKADDQTDDKVDDNQTDDNKVDDKADDNKADDNKADDQTDNKVDDNQTDDNKADDKVDDNKADDNKADDQTDDNKVVNVASSSSSSSSSSTPIQKSDKGKTSTKKSSSSSSSSTSDKSTSSDENDDDKWSVPKEAFVSREYTVTAKDIKDGRIQIEMKPQNGSVNKIYELTVVIYEDKSKKNRIGFHHQLINCSINTNEKTTLLQKIRDKRLYYIPTRR